MFPTCWKTLSHQNHRFTSAQSKRVSCKTLISNSERPVRNVVQNKPTFVTKMSQNNEHCLKQLTSNHYTNGNKTSGTVSLLHVLCYLTDFRKAYHTICCKKTVITWKGLKGPTEAKFYGERLVLCLRAVCKVESSLCLIKHNAMKTYWEVQGHTNMHRVRQDGNLQALKTGSEKNLA